MHPAEIWWLIEARSPTHEIENDDALYRALKTGKFDDV